MVNGKIIKILNMGGEFKYGQMGQNMLGIGKIIKHVVKVNYIMQMEMSMREIG